MSMQSRRGPAARIGILRCHAERAFIGVGNETVDNVLLYELDVDYDRSDK